MQSYYTEVTHSNKTIYINPNFKGQMPIRDTQSLETPNSIPKNAHINPLFLETHNFRNTIHMNPEFLYKFQVQQQQQQHEIVETAIPENDSKQFIGHNTDTPPCSLMERSVATETRKLICKSKNRLIREPLVKNNDQLMKTSYPLQPLIVLNKRKLIRKVAVIPTIKKSDAMIYNNSITSITKYKLDNRLNKKKPILPPTPRIRRTTFVARYALKRTSFCENSNATPNRSLSINNSRKLQVLNINGLLYKSTRNSLKLKNILTPSRILKSLEANAASKKLNTNTNQGLTIFVRGNKYIMDANKFKLTRATNSEYASPNRMTSNNSFKTSACKRIDIGGYTYVSTNSAKNVLIRTSNHLSRAYVHNAKQKSLQTLTKRLAKTNIPCPIFQRIGKCAAFERGKCSKVHNKLQVAICSKFLRGECHSSNCLLSHNVSLSKMPVCKFFLQGVCVRNDCQYLHKKLSNSAELCTEFLRGFCQMADKCNKRHEFTCPEIERNNICNTKNCIYCNAKKRKEPQILINSGKPKSNNETKSTLSLTSGSTDCTESESSRRYFIDSLTIPMENTADTKDKHVNEDNINSIDVTECSVGNTEKGLKSRPKLGALPAYIPL